MEKDKLINLWEKEERIAHIHGWDFSHIDGRYTGEADLPWNYRNIILHNLRPEMKLLDIDTGGGEFLLSLHHPSSNTSATEAYPPNIQLCQKILLPLGIDFRIGNGNKQLPFKDETFDMVINRHGNFNAKEIYRILKKDGLFITQQVGAENDRELIQLLVGKTKSSFPNQTLQIVSSQFRKAGFTILQGQECFRPIRFFDVGALVWFARIIQWEFPHFSVATHKDNLLRAQHILETNGCIEGSIHRFMLVAAKNNTDAGSTFSSFTSF